MRVRPLPLACVLIALLFVAACPAANPAPAEAPPADGPLAAVAPFVGGEWRIEGGWKNGEALKARETFEWGLAKKFVEVRTFVSRNDGSGEYERYRGVFAVKDGKLVSYNFAEDGSNTLDDVTVERKVLKIRRAITNVDVPTVILQEIERVGNDTFKWRVWLERDGKKDQIMDGEWVRKKAEAPAAKTAKP
jgi:hypothetical protein